MCAHMFNFPIMVHEAASAALSRFLAVPAIHFFGFPGALAATAAGYSTPHTIYGHVIRTKIGFHI